MGAIRTIGTKCRQAKIVHLGRYKSAMMYEMQTSSRDRLQRAREAAGFSTPSEAARAHPRDINKNTLISHENGNREISKPAAEKYGRIFGVDPGYILFGRTKTSQELDLPSITRVPLISMVSAGNLRYQEGVTQKEIERWITVADLPEGDWIALAVDGDSMNRIAPNGATILVNRSQATLLDERFYVFTLESGEATFKQFRRRPDRLQPYSTNPEHFAIPAPDELYVVGRVRRVIVDV